MIDLSADTGEGAPFEEQIWPLITSANVACGGHAGDSGSMAIASRQARQHGVNLGAHPSYPDRENFGRRSMRLPPDELHTSLLEQIASLQFLAEHFDMEVTRVKAHGALYNDAHRDRALADLLVDVLIELSPRLAIVCAESSSMAEAARARHVRVIREAFADRRYEEDGSLVSRTRPDALLDIDEAAEQASLLANEGSVIASGGTRISVPFDTVCIHSDMAGAVDRLKAIRKRLGLG